MSEIAINYKGSSIATMDDSGTKTLLTSGKYCEDNIEVVYSRPSGAQIDALSVTQNGTYTAQTGHAYSPVTVAVPTPLIVTLEWDSNQSKWLPDKTFSEISAAWTAERDIVVACDEAPGEVSADGMMNDNGIEYFYCVREYIDVDVGSAIRETQYIMTSNGITVDFEYLYPYPSLESVTITPSESQQSVSYDSTAYTGIDTVTVNAISSSYVGSGITRRSSSDLTASGATVTVPSGYYSAQASKAVSSGTEGTPTASKGAVNNHSISVTPSVTNTAGYISGGTHSGTAVTVTASELASGTKSITSNGSNIDVVGYQYATVNVPTVTITQSGSNLSIV